MGLESPPSSDPWINEKCSGSHLNVFWMDRRKACTDEVIGILDL